MSVIIVNGQIQQQFGGKTLQRRANDANGIGNLPGEISSRIDLRQLMRSFSELEALGGALTGWMEFPRGKHIGPRRLPWLLTSRRVWFLFAVERHAAARPSR